ncbi:MAG: hypothetical protein FP816_15195, partial [Desulfobacteraceae bacterium]|nr:hypothetical protein [Desulfobacteraceae bacterium]
KKQVWYERNQERGGKICILKRRDSNIQTYIAGVVGPYFLHEEVSKVSKMRLPKNLGMILLSTWLILTGLIALTNFSFNGLYMIMGILALAAGILILLDR